MLGMTWRTMSVEFLLCCFEVSDQVDILWDICGDCLSY